MSRWDRGEEVCARVGGFRCLGCRLCELHHCGKQATVCWETCDECGVSHSAASQHLVSGPGAACQGGTAGLRCASGMVASGAWEADLSRLHRCGRQPMIRKGGHAACCMLSQSVAAPGECPRSCVSRWDRGREQYARVGGFRCLGGGGGGGGTKVGYAW